MTAAILRMKPDGTGLETYAEAIRNSVGFSFCHGGDVPDPEFGAQRACSTTEPPVLDDRRVPDRIGPLTT